MDQIDQNSTADLMNRKTNPIKVSKITTFGIQIITVVHNTFAGQ